MKFTVDQDLCIGCEACNGISPEVFEFPNERPQGRGQLLGKCHLPHGIGMQTTDGHR